MNIPSALLPVALLLASLPARADVLAASATHFTLRHEADSALPPAALWQRLIEPATWWHPDHTYSGEAANLSLEARAGGLWREDWDGGSVAHGRVLYAAPGKTLRLEAPFGPLQGIGAYTVWTITITPTPEGSRVVFDEVSSVPPGSDLAALAKAVDGVKTEALRRLVAAPATD